MTTADVRRLVSLVTSAVAGKAGGGI